MYRPVDTGARRPLVRCNIHIHNLVVLEAWVGIRDWGGKTLIYDDLQNMASKDAFCSSETSGLSSINFTELSGITHLFKG